MTIWPTIAAAVQNAAHTAQAPLAWDPTNHLLSRFSFGPTTASRSYVAAHGPDGWYADQVATAKALPLYRGNTEIDARSALLKMTPYDLDVYLTNQGKKYGWDAFDQLCEDTLGLQAFSSAQLFETLVDFFSNHLNVPNHAGDMWNTRAAYDREIIRRYALGSFTDMLVASSKHSAMLTYLNLKDSTKNTINENYGREVLELHTVGMHYSETDMRNASRILTGRTVDDYGHYTYDEYIHATGAITVLGFTHANTTGSGGLAAGDALLKYLAAHTYTAQRLATKLCQHYVSDAPSAGLVASVAQAYLDGGTQILPMVETILRSDEFWTSRGLKVRRPRENLLAAVRVLGVTVTDWPKALQTLHWMTGSMGDLPLEWPAPNGFPDVAAAWRSSGSLLNLWNDHMAFAGSWAGGFSPCNLNALYGGVTPTTSGQAIDLLTKTITGMSWSTADRGALLTFLGEPDTTLMTASKMRWLAPSVVGLILHAPHHALR